QGCEIEPQTPRADRGEESARLMADQDKERTGRRLLEDLEQRIGRFRVDVLRCIDNADAPAAFSRRPRKKARSPSDVIDHYFGFQALVFDIIRAFEDEEIGMATRRDAPRDG